MKFQKKYAALALTAALAVSFGACGNAGTGREAQNSGETEEISFSVQSKSSGEETAAPEAAAPEAAEAGTSGEESSGGESSGETETGSHILIAYFTAAENSGVDAEASASYSEVNGEAKGRMQALAEMIQAETGGDLFSIRTEEVYPADGGDLIDYAAEEQDADARPALSSHIENLDQYDTVFIGYPNWWADLPQPLYTFFDEYDFSGKTIIPFNSHNGSRFSNTIATIEELEPGATVVENGFTVNERDVPDAAGDVAAWLEELGY